MEFEKNPFYLEHSMKPIVKEDRRRMQHDQILQGTLSLTHGRKSSMRNQDVFILPMVLISSFLNNQCILYHFLQSPSFHKSRDEIFFKGVAVTPCVTVSPITFTSL
jgi:hypothetical protein